jgi:hypothetical protein
MVIRRERTMGIWRAGAILYILNPGVRAEAISDLCAAGGLV